MEEEEGKETKLLSFQDKGQISRVKVQQQTVLMSN